ncbi:hypothetical protein [Streptomyces sp. NPDC008121]|uniref:hypothetical protein n=1 Tax=Streptomyces sp. NPDC008121 TaxID=3364809 RepID=UPI0036ECCE56
MSAIRGVRAVLSAAVIASAVFAGSATAEAAPGQVCSVPQYQKTTFDGWSLHNIRAGYPIHDWRTSKATFELSGEPQGCNGGQFFAATRGGRLLSLEVEAGGTSTPNWWDMQFKLPAGVTFAQVYYGDPGDMDSAVVLGSVSHLLP